MERSTAIKLAASAVAIGVTIYSGGILAPLLPSLLDEKQWEELGHFTTDLASDWLGSFFEDWWKGSDAESRARHNVIYGIKLAMASCLELTANEIQERQKKAYLSNFASELRHDKLELKSEKADAPIGPARLLDMLGGKESLAVSEWEELLQSVAPELKTSRFTELHLSDPQRAGILQQAAKTLASRFPEKLREGYTALGAENDPAWSDLLLRLLADIGADVKKTGKEVRGLAEFLTRMEEQITQLAARIRSGLQDVLQDPPDASFIKSTLPFLYAKQETQLHGETALQMLRHGLEFFLEDERKVCWWLWTGLEGAGKSRLAWEACAKARTLGWKAGFVSHTKLESFDERWSTCLIEGKFLLVFDYVGFDPLRVRRALYELDRRGTELPHAARAWKVRVLLLERHVASISPLDSAASLPQWCRELFKAGPGRADTERLLESQYPSSGERSFHLGALDTESARTLAAEYLAKLDRSNRVASGEDRPLSPAQRNFIVNKAVELAGANIRPLQVMIAARVLRDTQSQDFADFDDVMIRWMEHRIPLRREMLERVYGPQEAERFLNLLCISTVLGQIWLNHLPVHKLLPSEEATRNREFMTIFGQDSTNDRLNKLEPDLIGEWFVLYRTELERPSAGLTPEVLAGIVEECQEDKKGLADFVRRTYRYFHDKTLHVESQAAKKSALWRVLRGSLGRYASTTYFGEVFDHKQRQLLGGTTGQAEEYYDRLVIETLEAAIQAKPNRVPVVVDLMAGGSARPQQLLKHFGNKIKLLAIDRDDSRLREICASNFKIARLQIDKKFSLAETLEEAFGRTTCNVIIAKKALHELAWPTQRKLIGEMGECVSGGGSVVLYADSPKFMDPDSMDSWASNVRWLMEQLPIDGADDSAEVREQLFPPVLIFDPADPSAAAVFTNYWIKLKDWANYNRHEFENRYFSSRNQLEDAFCDAGFQINGRPQAFCMEIQATRFVEEAINRLGYLYSDPSIQKEELEGVISQNHRYPLFWAFAKAHLWEKSGPSDFGCTLNAKIGSGGLEDLLPEMFLRDNAALKLSVPAGPSFQMPIHVFGFQKPS